MVARGIQRGMTVAFERLFSRLIDALMRRPAIAIAVTWIGVELIQLIEWEVVTILVLLVLVRLTREISRSQQVIDPWPERPLVLAVAVALVAQFAFALAQLWHPRLIDIPVSVLDAGRALLAGLNPYTSEIDHTVTWPTELEFVHGFKYSPLMAIAYMPLGVPLGDRGIILTNILLQGTATWLIYRLARDRATRATGLTAALAYLVLIIMPWEVFHQGVTDLAPVVPLLGALLYADRKPGFAGLLVGISLSTKLIPAGLLLPCCLPTSQDARVRYVIGIMAGALPLLVAALWSPLPVWNNLVVFNLTRPPDKTSWLYWAPPLMGPVARAVLVTVYLWIGAALWRSRTVSIPVRCGLCGIMILTAILTSPASHNNYQLWWIPFASIVLAVGLAAHARTPATPELQFTTR
jgi:glycosyl transferase family 87